MTRQDRDLPKFVAVKLRCQGARDPETDLAHFRSVVTSQLRVAERTSFGSSAHDPPRTTWPLAIARPPRRAVLRQAVERGVPAVLYPFANVAVNVQQAERVGLGVPRSRRCGAAAAPSGSPHRRSASRSSRAPSRYPCRTRTGSSGREPRSRAPHTPIRLPTAAGRWLRFAARATPHRRVRRSTTR